jgi:hypothetical protein
MRHFEPGDIIAPADQIKNWIDVALVVNEVDGDGTIRASALGGGLVYEFGPLDLYKFVKVPKKLLNDPQWRSAEFYLGDEPDDWGGVYRGWTTGQRWNGWAMPHFEFEEAMRFANASPGEAKTTYDREKDAFVTVMDGEEEPYVDEGDIIIVRGRGPLVVYPVGAGNWTWTERSEKEEEEDEDESSLDGRRKRGMKKRSKR